MPTNQAQTRSPLSALRLPWPLPALAAWALAWALFLLCGRAGAAPWLGLLAGVGVGVGLALALRCRTRMRSLITALGFPLSVVAGGAAVLVPAWSWLLPLAALLLLYPRSSWRDAPLFPTPPGALDGLPAVIALPSAARVLDAGCGLGHGLRALRRAYPDARLEGVEGSRPLARAARLWRRDARVRCADMWAESWQRFDLVYLFQRPESMPRALAKAGAEMADGSWLASLEFAAPGWRAQAVLRCPDGRPLWLYRLPLRPAGVSSGADPGR
jgi:hypothetical protein